MTCTYQFTTPDNSVIKRTDENGNVAFIPADIENTDYAKFVSSKSVAASYVAPEPPPELTTAEKVDNMLQAFGLTREEMQAALAVKSGKK